MLKKYDTNPFSCDSFGLMRNFIITLILTSLIINIFSSDHHTVICSGISEKIDEASSIIKSFGLFWQSIASMLAVVAGVIGLEVFILLIAVALVQFGLSLFGIPKGRILFFCSLAVADIFWYTWINSFYKDELLPKYFQIIKSNIILIIPFILVYFGKSSLLKNRILPGIIRILKSPFVKKEQQKMYYKSELIELSGKLYESNRLLHQSMLNDVMNQKDKDKFALSDLTKKYGMELEELLGKLGKD